MWIRVETVGVCSCGIIKIHMHRAIRSSVVDDNENLDDAASAIIDYVLENGGSHQVHQNQGQYTLSFPKDFLSIWPMLYLLVCAFLH